MILRNIIFLILSINTSITFSQKQLEKLNKKDSLAIIELTFREFFNNNASATKTNASFYCISLSKSLDNFPISEVLNSLIDVNPKVIERSEFQKLSDAEKVNLKPLFFEINSINIDESGKYITVGCTYYEGNLSSSFNLMKLYKKGKKWKLLKNEVIEIS